MLNFDPKEHEQEENREVYLDDMLQLSYRGQEIEFWEKLQELHDENNYWLGGNKIWLTEDGYLHITEMAETFMYNNEERLDFLDAVQEHTEEMS